jgi:hypothetical protein
VANALRPSRVPSLRKKPWKTVFFLRSALSLYCWPQAPPTRRSERCWVLRCLLALFPFDRSCEWDRKLKRAWMSRLSPRELLGVTLFVGFISLRAELRRGSEDEEGLDVPAVTSRVPCLRKKLWKGTAVPQFHAASTSAAKRLRTVRPAVRLGRCGPRPSSLRFATPGEPGSLHSEKCPEKRSFFAVQRRSLIAAAQANCRAPLAVCNPQGSQALMFRTVSHASKFHVRNCQEMLETPALKLIEDFRW